MNSVQCTVQCTVHLPILDLGTAVCLPNRRASLATGQAASPVTSSQHGAAWCSQVVKSVGDANAAWCRSVGDVIAASCSKVQRDGAVQQSLPRPCGSPSAARPPCLAHGVLSPTACHCGAS